MDQQPGCHTGRQEASALATYVLQFSCAKWKGSKSWIDQDCQGPEAMEMYWTFRFKALKRSEQRNDLISHFNKITLVALQKTDFSGTKVEERRTDKNYTPIKINELI